MILSFGKQVHSLLPTMDSALVIFFIMHSITTCVAGIRRTVAACKQLEEISIENPGVVSQIDPTVDPCTDFRSFACGGDGGLPLYERLRRRERVASWGPFDIAHGKVEETVAEILLESNASYPHPFSEVLQMYRSCKDLDEELEHPAELMKELETWIDKTISWRPNKKNVWNNIMRHKFTRSLARMIKFGAPLFFNIDVMSLSGRSGAVLGKIEDNGFPNIFDVTLETFSLVSTRMSKATSVLLEAYKSLGYPVEERDLNVEKAMQLIKYVVDVGKKRKNMKYRIAECARGPEVRLQGWRTWDAFCKELGLSGTAQIVWVHMTEGEGGDLGASPFQDFTEVSLNPIEMMRALEVIMLIKLAPYLGGSITSTYFDLQSGKAKGAKSLSPGIPYTLERNLLTYLGAFCDKIPEEHFKWLLSRYVVDKAFPEKANEAANNLALSIKKAFLETLDAMSWMDEDTKREARSKAIATEFEVGVPAWVYEDTEVRKHYAALDLKESVSFFANYMQVLQWAHANKISGIDKPKDTKKWTGSPLRLSAYYNPKLNRIVFPAGSMFEPIFRSDAHPALFYGGLGAVMGHEFMHGFDEQGSKLDATGNRRNWWTDSATKDFHDRLKCFQDQYDGMTVEVSGEHIHVDGEKTLNENVADNAGLALAWRAFQDSKGEDASTASLRVNSSLQLSADQLFFVGFAQLWCPAQLDYYKGKALKNGVHALDEIRIKAVLRNSPAFARAFNCPVPSTMIPIEERCSLFDGIAWNVHAEEEKQDAHDAPEQDAQDGHDDQLQFADAQQD